MKRPVFIVLLLLIVGLIVGWIFGRQQLANWIITKELGENLSCEVARGATDWSLDGRTLTIDSLVLTNPDMKTEFPMLQLDGLKIQIAPWSLLLRPIRLTNLELDIEQITLLRHADGTTNADCISDRIAALLPPVKTPKVAPRAKGAGAADAAPEAAVADSSGGGSTPIRIDRLRLEIHQISVRDFGRGGKEAMTADLELDFRETYTNLESMDDLRERLKASGEEIVQSLMIY